MKRIIQKTIKKWHGRQHYEYQQQITAAICDALESAARGETSEIPIELPRQCGKTTAVVDVVEVLLALWENIYKRTIRIGIFAPQKEQATTDFDRLKIQYMGIGKLGFKTKMESNAELKFPEKWNSKTIRLFNKMGRFLGEVYIFPISKTSNPESKTLDIAIIEEAQDVNDEKMKKSVFPMLASTNGPRIYIGTAGTKLCYFKRQIDNNPRKIKITLEEVFKQRREAHAKDGNNLHLLYEAFVRHEIEKHGEDSEYIRTQYKGEWIIGSGQFTTPQELDALTEKGRSTITENKSWVEKDRKNREIQHSAMPCYVGIDTAKSPDKTVVTIVRDHPTDPLRAQLCGWLEIQGENYEDQFDIMKDWLKQFEGIRAIAIDATGQADFMPDKFERHTSYNIIRVKFSAETKDVIYKILQQTIKSKLTTLPDVPMDSKYRTFRQEMLDLEKEWNGRFMSCHHPDSSDAHDDYPDSWALAEFARSEKKKNEPRLTFI